MAAEAAPALAQLLAPHGVLAWLATYLVHSTMLLAGAWAASRWLRGRSLHLEERLWKAALVGGLLTATVQTGLAALPPAPAPAAEAAAATAAPPLRWPSATTGLPAAEAPAPDPRLRQLGAVLPGWQRLALAGWIGGCLLLTGGLGAAWVRLRLRLRGREEVVEGEAPRLLDRLLARTTARRRVRLTGTSSLPVPVALGVGEREICLPRRALRELDERRQAGLLAHELAHLERRDPAWLLAALGLQSVFFFQPLNRLARRRLEEISELQCDAWAVRATGDRVGLARCLTEVASWLVAERSALPAPGMARSRSGLGVRVRRILEGDGEEPARRRWLAAAAAAGLVAAALLVPGLSPATFAAAEPADRQAAEPATPPAEEATAAAPREEATAARRAETDRERTDEDADHDVDLDIDVDYDLSEVAEVAELDRLVAEALAAAHAAMPDPAELAEIQERVREVAELHDEALELQREALEEMSRELGVELGELAEGRELSAAEAARVRYQIDRELAAARAEMARAMAEAAPALEELRALEPMNRQLRVELEEELRRAHAELELARREMRRELESAVRIEREEVRRELDVAHRELEEARRELDRQRRELERQRRELDERRERLEREEEPPGR